MKKRVLENKGFLLFIFAWAFSFFILNSAPLLDDYDTYWHITAGKWILSNKSVILPNSWSFSDPNHYWYNMSWLWDVFCYLLFNLNEKAPFLISCIISAATITCAASYLKQKNILNPLTIIFSIFLLTLVIWDFSVSRPQIVTYLFAIIYMLLTEYYNKSKQTKFLYFLPLIMIVWVNMHGGFVVGCLILIFRFLENWAKKENIKKLDFVFLTWCCLTAISILLNPYHFKIVYAITSTTASQFTKSIDEWQSYQFGKGFFAFSVYLLLFIFSFDIKNKQVALIDKIHAAFWLFMSLLHVRNIAIFTILSLAFFAINFQRLNILRKIDIQTQKPGYAILLIALITAFYFSPLMSEKIKPDADRSKAIQFLIKNYPNSNFLNEYSLGGAIIFFSDGKQKVFVDGRAGTAYSEEVLQEYLNLPISICQRNNELMKKYNIKGFILSKAHAFNSAFKKNTEWKKIYSDQHYLVYEFLGNSALP